MSGDQAAPPTARSIRKPVSVLELSIQVRLMRVSSGATASNPPGAAGAVVAATVVLGVLLEAAVRSCTGPVRHLCEL
jgi:hypothetical protein